MYSQILMGSAFTVFGLPYRDSIANFNRPLMTNHSDLNDNFIFLLLTFF